MALNVRFDAPVVCNPIPPLLLHNPLRTIRRPVVVPFPVSAHFAMITISVLRLNKQKSNWEPSGPPSCLQDERKTFFVYFASRTGTFTGMRGRFITFEGPEGSGKSTQATLLRDRLLQRGVRSVCTREPGGTALGEAVRRILQFDDAGESPCPRAELLLFAAARAQLTERLIRPALQRGDWVLCDRFFDSTTVYQGAGRGLPIDEITQLNRMATGGLVPDITLLLDLDVETGLQRVARRGCESAVADRFELEHRAFHERVRRGYLELARSEPNRFRVVDASRPPEVISAEIDRLIMEPPPNG